MVTFAVPHQTTKLAYTARLLLVGGSVYSHKYAFSSSANNQ